MYVCVLSMVLNEKYKPEIDKISTIYIWNMNNEYTPFLYTTKFEPKQYIIPSDIVPNEMIVKIITDSKIKKKKYKTNFCK